MKTLAFKISLTHRASAGCVASNSAAFRQSHLLNGGEIITFFTLFRANQLVPMMRVRVAVLFQPAVDVGFAQKSPGAQKPASAEIVL